MIKVKVTGLNKVRQNMKRQGQKGLDAFRGAVYAEGVHVIDKAVENAPAVTGRLRNSHFVTWPDRRGNIEIGFATVYAAAVEFGTRLINVSRQRQKAAFANMRESGWRKSATGGPGFFRRAISGTSGGRVQRVAQTAKRYFETGIGFVAIPGKAKSASEARTRGKG